MQTDTTIVKKTNHRMLLKVTVYALVIASILLWLFTQRDFLKQESSNPDYIDISYPIILQGDIDLEVFIADTPTERSSGLSLFTELRGNESLLFIFDESGMYPFWMKDMSFAIDIVWLDSEGSIVFIKEDAQPSDYPSFYHPDKEAQYVIEFVSGFVEKQGLAIGDSFKVLTTLSL